MSSIICPALLRFVLDQVFIDIFYIQFLSKIIISSLY